MKIWSSEHIFNHNWENVVKAALNKYPNPLNPSVIGVDVVDRKVDENGNIQSHRLLASKWGLSPWIASLIGGNRTVFCSEHSTIDPQTKMLSMRSRNLSCNNIINVDETLIYSLHPTDSTKTLLRQEAVITVENVPLTDYLENMLETKINSNAKIGRQAIEFIINKMNTITDEAKSSVTDISAISTSRRL